MAILWSLIVRHIEFSVSDESRNFQSVFGAFCDPWEGPVIGRDGDRHERTPAAPHPTAAAATPQLRSQCSWVLCWYIGTIFYQCIMEKWYRHFDSRFLSRNLSKNKKVWVWFTRQNHFSVEISHSTTFFQLTQQRLLYVEHWLKGLQESSIRSIFRSVKPTRNT